MKQALDAYGLAEGLWDSVPNGRFVGNNSTIPHDQVAFIASIIDSSNIAGRIDGWQELDSKDQGPGGRPRVVSTRTVLILLLLLTAEHSSQLVNEVAYIAHARLSPESSKYLGLDGAASLSRGKKRTESQWYFIMWRALHRALSTIDPKPHTSTTRGKFPTLAEVAEMKERWTEDGLQERLRRLELVNNELLEATMKLVPKKYAQLWKGDTCIDATVVPAYGGRGQPFGGTHGANDPSAGWYVRGTNHEVLEKNTKKKVKKAVFGWDLTLVTQTNHDPADLPGFPMLIAGLGMNVPATGLIQTATRIYTDINRRGHAPGRATGDRGYGSGAKAAEFQLPVRKLGYTMNMDYNDDQLGGDSGEEFGGAIQVEGAWYCPSMPPNLINTTKRMRAGEIDHTTWRKQIVERRAYMLRPKEKPDANGSVPMMCPARGPGATASCPLVEGCSTADKDVHIFTPPDEDHQGAICTNKRSVTFPMEAGAKQAQEEQYGSDVQQRQYATDRNGIEGKNAQSKDEAHELLGSPGRRRIRGFAAQFLLVSMLIATTNLRRIQKFRDERLKSASELEHQERLARKAVIRENRRTRDDRQAPWGDFSYKEPADTDDSGTATASAAVVKQKRTPKRVIPPTPPAT